MACVPLHHSIDELNDFFVRSIGVLNSSCESRIDIYAMTEYNKNNFYWNYVTLTTISNVLRRTSSRTKDATGSDRISPRLIKLVLPYIMPAIEHIFNYSFMNGIFPSQWKSTIVCPIPKNKNPTSVQHYRSISILPALSKALERVACKQICKR